MWHHDGAPNAVLWQRQEAALLDFIGARGAQLACKTNHSVNGGAELRTAGTGIAVLRHGRAYTFLRSVRTLTMEPTPASSKTFSCQSSR